MNQLSPIATPLPLPVLIAAAGDHASFRFLEFFAGTIRNPHTRRAYARHRGLPSRHYSSARSDALLRQVFLA